jgi:hypothetical protein
VIDSWDELIDYGSSNQTARILPTIEVAEDVDNSFGNTSSNKLAFEDKFHRALYNIISASEFLR